MIALLFLFAACGGGQPGALDECESHSLGSCETVQTCCNATDCYFLVDGEQYSCGGDGKDCDAAVAEIEDYCGDTGEQS